MATKTNTQQINHPAPSELKWYHKLGAIAFIALAFFIGGVITGWFIHTNALADAKASVLVSPVQELKVNQ